MLLAVGPTEWSCGKLGHLVIIISCHLCLIINGVTFLFSKCMFLTCSFPFTKSVGLQLSPSLPSIYGHRIWYLLQRKKNVL